MDNMEEIGASIRKEHFSEEIDLISIVLLIVMLVAMWMAKRIMIVITGVAG